MLRLIEVVEKILFALSALALFAMMILVSLDVLFRYFLHRPLTFQYELTSYYLLVCATTLSLPVAYKRGAFIKLDLLGKHLPTRLHGYLRGCNLLVGALLFLLITWFSGTRTYDQWQSGGSIFGVIDWPVWLSLIWVPIGCFMLSLTLLLYAFNAFRDPIAAINVQHVAPEDY